MIYLCLYLFSSNRLPAQGGNNSARAQFLCSGCPVCVTGRHASSEPGQAVFYAFINLMK
jgi:hypothetical protein